MPCIRQAALGAAISVASLFTPTLALSNAVVYGNLDLGIVKESGVSTRLDRGYNNWIGFKGQEELGGGLAAIFNLQARFKPDTGEQERPLTFWQGESTVGLKSATLGTVRLGRALSPLWHNVWAFEPWQNSGFNASLSAYQTGSYSSDGVNDAAFGFANFSRISNGVFYTSPELGGLTVHIAAEAERSPGASSRVAGTSLNYANGPLGAMISYERNARRDRIYFLGASYQFGPATLMSSYAANEQAGSRVREHTWVVAGTYDIGAGSLRAGYGRNRDNGSDKISAGYVHSLSRRTRLYTDIYREKLSGSRNGLAVGINHTF